MRAVPEIDVEVAIPWLACSLLSSAFDPLHSLVIINLGSASAFVRQVVSVTASPDKFDNVDGELTRCTYTPGAPTVRALRSVAAESR